MGGGYWVGQEISAERLVFQIAVRQPTCLRALMSVCCACMLLAFQSCLSASHMSACICRTFSVFSFLSFEFSQLWVLNLFSFHFPETTSFKRCSLEASARQRERLSHIRHMVDQYGRGVSLLFSWGGAPFRLLRVVPWKIGSGPCCVMLVAVA